MKVQVYSALEFPLDTPVNSYLLPELGVLIDAGIQPPRHGYDYVYVTHWHWDHVLGLSVIESKTVCMPRRTIEILEKRSYAERFLTILRAGGVRLSPMEEMFIQEMDRRYRSVSEGLSKNTVLPVEECPHVLRGEIRILDCPGHSIDHVCYIAGNALFAGDTLLPGTRSTIIDFEAHRRSLVEMLAAEWSILYPGHGSPVARGEAKDTAIEYLVGRCRRAYSILAALSRANGEMGLDSLLRQVYGVEPGLRSFVALRTLVGYLAELERYGLVRVNRSVSPWRVMLV